MLPLERTLCYLNNCILILMIKRMSNQLADRQTLLCLQEPGEAGGSPSHPCFPKDTVLAPHPARLGRLHLLQSRKKCWPWPCLNTTAQGDVALAAQGTTPLHQIPQQPHGNLPNLHQYLIAKKWAQLDISQKLLKQWM